MGGIGSQKIQRVVDVEKRKLEVCGTCKHNKHDTVDWYCGNTESDMYTDYTLYGDACELWERKEGST